MATTTLTPPEPVRDLAAQASYHVTGAPLELAADAHLLMEEAHGTLELATTALNEHGSALEANPKILLQPLHAAMRLLRTAQAVVNAMEAQARTKRGGAA